MNTCQAVGTLISYGQSAFINMNRMTGTDILTNAAMNTQRRITPYSKPFFSQPL